MKTNMTIFVPELNILETVSKEILKLDIDNPFVVNGKSEEYFNVEPFVYTEGGNFATAISKKQLDNFNIYNSFVINDSQKLADILENEFKINLFCSLNVSSLVVTYSGDCEEYQGEKIAIKKMIEYAENLKQLCINK